MSSIYVDYDPNEERVHEAFSIMDLATLTLEQFIKRLQHVEVILSAHKDNEDDFVEMCKVICSIINMLYGNIDSVFDESKLQISDTIKSEHRRKNEDYFVYQFVGKVSRLLMSKKSDMTSSMKFPRVSDAANEFQQALIILCLYHFEQYLFNNTKLHEQLKKLKSESTNPDASNQIKQILSEQKIADECILSLMETLEIIFQAGNPFYETRDSVYVQNSKLLAQDSLFYSVMTQNNPMATWETNHDKFVFSSPNVAKNRKFSCYFIRNVNTFGQHGGFATLFKLANQEYISLLFLKRLLRPFIKMSDGVNPKLLDDFIPKMKEKIFHFVNNMDDETIKNESQKNLTELISYAYQMVKRHWPDKAAEIQDTLSLDTYFKLFTSKSLDKRLTALGELKNIIKDTVEEDNCRRFQPRQFINGTAAIQPMQPASKNPLWLTIKYINKWIEDKQLLSCIFEGDIHPEIIRQSKAILLFIAQQQRGFKQRDIDMVWQSSVDKHETTQRLVYELIIGLLPVMGITATNSFFAHIEEMKVTDFKDHTLEFIRDFTVEAVINVRKLKDRKKKWYGLDMFWDLCMKTDIKTSVKIRTKAFNCLQSLLERDEFESQRKLFIKRCITNLKNHVSVVQSLNLLKSIIGTFPVVKRKKKHSVWGIVDQLNDKNKLIDLFLDDIATYCASLSTTEISKEKKGNKKETKKDEQEDDTEQLRARLEFLNYLLYNSSLSLSFDQCLKLWNSIYDNVLYREICVEWFEGVRSNVDSETQFYIQQHQLSPGNLQPIQKEIDGPSHEPFQDGVTERIFNDIIIAKIDTSTMRESEFRLFLTFFISINLDHKRITAVYENEEEKDQDPKPQKNNGVLSKITNSLAPKPAALIGLQFPEKSVPKKMKLSKYMINCNELIGVDHLWKIILTATSERVGQQAIQYLNQFRNQVCQDLQSLVRSDHVADCMSRLIQSKDDERQIARCLDVLLSFVYLFLEKIGGIRNGRSFVSPGFPLKIRVMVIDGPKLILTMMSVDTLSRLLSRIGAEINHSPSLLRIYAYKGEELTIFNDDTKTLEQLEINGEQLILVKRINIKDVAFSLLDTQLQMLGLKPIADALFKQSLEQYRTILKPPSNNVSLSPSSSSDGYIVSVTDITNVSDSSSSSQVDSDFVILEQIEDEKTYPTVILSQGENFTRLLSLLDASDEIAKRVWTLLLHLPANSHISTAMKDISKAEHREEVNWEEALPTKGSIHKLLYALQIIDLNLKRYSVDARQNDGFDINRWNHNFVSLGGLDHLFDTLILSSQGSYSFSRTPLHKECLALLFKVVNRFIISYLSLEYHKRYLNIIINAILQLVPQVIFDFSVSDEDSTDDQVITDKNLSLLLSDRRNVMTKENDHVESDRAVLEQFFSLLATITQHDSQILALIYKSAHLIKFFRSCLLENEHEEIRLEMAKGLKQLLTIGFHASSLSTLSLVPVLFSFLSDVDQYPQTCEQYFALLQNLLDNRSESIPEEFYGKQTLLNLIKTILERPIIEKDSKGSVDKVLVGLLNLSRILLRIHADMKAEVGSSKHGAGLIQEIFHAFLFDVPNGNVDNKDRHVLPPKCKTAASRNASFGLLVELVDQCEDNYSELSDMVSKYLSQCERHYQWSFWPEAMEKTKTGYVGLKNQGATCYMNSLLQQFFMTVPFRKGLFSVNVLEYRDDNTALLRQMQQMFGYLQDSGKKYYDTKEFCRAYKDFEGNSVSCSVQQDANEFFNLFLDKIEAALKGTAEEKLLENVFGGRILNQVLYEENQKQETSETYEPFYILSLEVKNKKNILESLDMYIHGELLEGNNMYWSDKLQKSINARKRALIKNLPNVLILHLKRFEFDLSKMRNKKINDRLEFFHQLDMEPYTVERVCGTKHRDPEYYQYTLVGVLVHSGSAESGHYYSYIMDRMAEEPRWLEFNDTTVIPFDSKDLEKECFGGADEIIVKDQGTGKTTVCNTVYRSNNAYMLFYQRTSTLNMTTFPEQEKLPVEADKEKRNDITEQTDDNQTNGEIEQIVLDTCTSENNCKSKSIVALEFVVKLSAARRKEMGLQKQSEMPITIKDCIWKDNSRFYHDKNIYNESFDCFLWEFMSCKVGKHSQILANAELSTQYVIDFLAHSRLADKALSKWFGYLGNLFAEDRQACIWFLDTLADNSTWRTEMILKCPSNEIRSAFQVLVMSCIRMLHKHKSSNIQENAVKNEHIVDGSQSASATTLSIDREQATICKLIDAVLTMMSDTRFYYRQTTEFFQLLDEFAQLGLNERHILIKREVVSMMILLINGEAPERSNASYQMSQLRAGKDLASSFGRASLRHMINVVSLLTCTCETTVTSKALPPTMLRGEDDPRIELPSNCRNKLFHRLLHRPFFSSLIKEDVTIYAIQDILTHYCWENLSLTESIMELVIDVVSQELEQNYGPIVAIGTAAATSSDTRRSPFLYVLESFINISDSLQKHRLTKCMQRFIQIMTDNVKNARATLVCVKFITHMSATNEMAKTWLLDHMKEVEEVCSYHNWQIKKTTTINV